MGAAAFIMAETLGIPYNTLILVAIVPAMLHYFAILYMVHLEAKRLKLEGMDPADIPSLMWVMKSSWHLFIPLVVMVTLLLMQFTPFSGCFLGHHAHGCLLLDSTLDWTAGQKHDRIGCGTSSIGARL
jgi:TRAP-type uncharacterized transport system fused permease subunit